MIHGRRFWYKRFERTPERNVQMLRVMLGQLFGHERIMTTVPKAKWLQHKADDVIAWAKMNTPESIERIRPLLSSSETVLPKVTGLIANRYREYVGRYTRIVRAGHRMTRNDRAPMAFIELVYNPGDIRFTQASFQREAALEKLAKVRNELYHTVEHTLYDPVTSKPETVTEYIVKPSQLRGFRGRLIAKEWAIIKTLNRMDRATYLYGKAREDDARFFAQMKEEITKKHATEVKKKQVEVDKIVEVHRCVPTHMHADVLGDNFKIDDNNVVSWNPTPAESVLLGEDVVHRQFGPKKNIGRGILSRHMRDKIAESFNEELARLRYSRLVESKIAEIGKNVSEADLEKIIADADKEYEEEQRRSS